jgi:GWxTD domain-containing protein
MTSSSRSSRIGFSSVVALMLFLSGFIAPLYSQDEDRPRERYGEESRSREQSAQDVISFESHTFAADSGMVRIDILYRVRYDFFVFTRDFSSDGPVYRAHGELLIELIDSTDTSVSRKVQAISLQSDDNESTQLRLHYYQGAASFVVHPGRFTSLYHMEDKESRREFGDRRQILHVAPFKSQALVQSSPFFVDAVADPSAVKQFTAINDNNATQLSKNAGTFIILKDGDAPPSVRYSLTQFLPEGKDRTMIQEDTEATATVFRHAVPRLAQTTGDKVAFELDSSATMETVYFTLATSRLKQGRYAAHIHVSAGDTATVNREFSVRWTDMPLSLYDLDFAVIAMRYITTDSEYDDLRSGSRESRIKKFEDFWAKRNTVPGSAYNEMMAVYFRRVDYTFTNFRTLKEENGALTDRGKVYILYGKPSSIERSLAPGGPPKETWIYSMLNRQFIFEDPSRQGNYKLIESGTR